MVRPKRVGLDGGSNPERAPRSLHRVLFHVRSLPNPRAVHASIRSAWESRVRHLEAGLQTVHARHDAKPPVSAGGREEQTKGAATRQSSGSATRRVDVYAGR